MNTMATDLPAVLAGVSATHSAFGLIASVLVVAAMIALIASKEGKRARHIEHDLQDMAVARHITPAHHVGPDTRRRERGPRHWWERLPLHR